MGHPRCFHRTGDGGLLKGQILPPLSVPTNFTGHDRSSMFSDNSDPLPLSNEDPLVMGFRRNSTTVNPTRDFYLS